MFSADGTYIDDWGVLNPGDLLGDIQISTGGGGGTITVGGVSISVGGGADRDMVVAITNAVEQVLQANYNDYRAGRKSATAAATSFDAIWADYYAQMQRYGTEGTRALQDRNRGGKFDWYAAYRPAGVASTGTASGGTTPVLANTPSGSKLPALAILAAGAWFMWRR